MSDATTTAASEIAQADELISVVESGGQAVTARMLHLQRQRDALSRQILQLEILSGGARPEWNCLRCGYEWIGYNVARPPHHCPRCHSTGWQTEPWSDRCRKPGDPPHPKWRRKATVKEPTPIVPVTEQMRAKLQEILGPYVPRPDTLPPPPVSLSSQLTEISRRYVPQQEEQPERLSQPPAPTVPVDPDPPVPVEPDLVGDEELPDPDPEGSL